MKLWMAPGGLHVEPGRVADAGAFATLHAEAFYRGWASSEFAAFLADPDRTPAYVACDRKRKIAGFALFRIGGAESELLTLVIARKQRGRGIGRALLVAGLDDLMQTGVGQVFLEVEEANLAAIHLYRTLGFEQVGRREGYYQGAAGQTNAALVMKRVLG